MSTEKSVSSRDSAIAELFLKIMKLKELIRALEEERNSLLEGVQALTEQVHRSFSPESIAAFVEKSFNEGMIPFPKDVSDMRCPVKVECSPQDLRFLSRGICASVWFHCSGRTDRVEFLFKITPDDEFYYPDFHIGYTKPTTRNTRSAQSRKKAAQKTVTTS